MDSKQINRTRLSVKITRDHYMTTTSKPYGLGEWRYEDCRETYIVHTVAYWLTVLTKEIESFLDDSTKLPIEKERCIR